MYLENGDLHDDGRNRQKKFSWKNAFDNKLQIEYQDSEDDGSNDEDQDIKRPVLKMLDNEDSIQNSTSLSINEQQLKRSNAFMSLQKSNSLSSFIIRDERLKSIISNPKVNCEKQMNRPRKKQKTCKNTDNNLSIFDFITV